MAKLIIEVAREGYATDQIHDTMTVGDLIDELEQYDEDTRVYVSHDNGYTFGGIRAADFHGDEE